MGINKVIYNGQVLIDLTSSTVTPETLLEDTIAFNSAGEKIVGTLVIFGGYTNQVPVSIDTDGSVYNSVGYIDGYRLSSSGSLSQQADTVTTGFIPCKSTDVIRMGGTDWLPLGGTAIHFNYIAFYDSKFNLLGSYNISELGSNVASGIVDTDVSKSSVVTDESGVTTFKIAFTDGSEVAYCRVNGYGKGADMIITVNEAIVEKPYTYTNQVPISIGTDKKVYNGTGWKENYRLSASTGNESANQASITGFIPVKAGDIVRFKFSYLNNATWDLSHVQVGWNSMVYYNGSFGWLGSACPVQGYQYGICTSNDFSNGSLADGGVVSFKVPNNANIAYLRLSFSMATTVNLSLKNLIVTVNEEI